MERDDSSAFELWIVVKQRAQHPSDCETKTCCKVAEDNFRTVTCNFLVISFQISRQLYIA